MCADRAGGRSTMIVLHHCVHRDKSRGTIHSRNSISFPRRFLRSNDGPPTSLTLHKRWRLWAPFGDGMGRPHPLSRSHTLALDVVNRPARRLHAGLDQRRFPEPEAPPSLPPPPSPPFSWLPINSQIGQSIFTGARAGGRGRAAGQRQLYRTPPPRRL